MACEVILGRPFFEASSLNAPRPFPRIRLCPDSASTSTSKEIVVDFPPKVTSKIESYLAGRFVISGHLHNSPLSTDLKLQSVVQLLLVTMRSASRN